MSAAQIALHVTAGAGAGMLVVLYLIGIGPIGIIAFVVLSAVLVVLKHRHDRGRAAPTDG